MIITLHNVTWPGLEFNISNWVLKYSKNLNKIQNFFNIYNIQGTCNYFLKYTITLFETFKLFIYLYTIWFSTNQTLPRRILDWVVEVNCLLYKLYFSSLFRLSKFLLYYVRHTCISIALWTASRLLSRSANKQGCDDEIKNAYEFKSTKFVARFLKNRETPCLISIYFLSYTLLWWFLEDRYI